ncbi:methyltransferase [Candidatus Methylobacter oryzae]|uniref:Ribosomal RNA large subunit methyltransferase G n=1 Tax=Candidatus Methylobacter oryzae TaxID=2497749 RepID=A0ABY3C9N8_9GAMM|nr:methyltransferase [Candidatus Methylobacter oryzae]TRW90817.1 methyltransferase [Candidatus Methylobacter oryzae]
MTIRLTVAQGEFELNRLPKRPRELLQAWDAADEYLLDTVAEKLKLPEDARILIVNDSFGALAVALNAFRPHAISDSYLSQQATRLNLAANGLPEHSVSLLNSLDILDGAFDLVLIKVPKTLALLEDELIRLRPHLTASTQVILAGMIKNLPPSVWKLLERLIGPTTTSLAKKKARLIFTALDAELAIPSNPYPVYYRLENTEYLIVNHANVFSRDSLDIGTRFFLQHLPFQKDVRDIIDLGCGNGLVGLIAAERNPAATVHFFDESFMAVASARENFYLAFGEQREATFHVGDGLMEAESASADLILCNPPFHQQNTVGDQIAVGLFQQARRVLRQGGELWVIGNRHLDYHIYLGRLFGNHEIVASNAKFVVVKAVLRG